MAQTRRFETVSDWASIPSFATHSTPLLSFTLIFGETPPLSSSTKVNGGFGANAADPGPYRRSRRDILPGSRQRTALFAKRLFWAKIGTDNRKESRSETHTSVRRFASLTIKGPPF